MITPTNIAVIAIVFVCSLFGTRLLISQLTKREILDRPNERSSHAIPTPRGGGIAVTLCVLAGWGVLWFLSSKIWPGEMSTALLSAMAGAVLLAAISFADDILTLKARSRFAVQIIAVAIGLWFLPQHQGVFSDWLPVWVDLALTGLIWLWFLNLFNFMDGIDGISGVETLSISIGVILLGLTGLAAPALVLPALVITASILGFLKWNWSPARIFLGDVGSIPIGYLLGWLLIMIAGGAKTGGAVWTAVFILPLYYVVDASIILIKRTIRRENIFEAHRQHFYQQAVIKGHGHAKVCLAIALCNVVLIVTAVYVTSFSLIAAAAISIGSVTALLLWMKNTS